MVRFKYRYLLAEIKQEKAKNKLSKDDLNNAIKASIQENFGDYGSGILQSTYQIKYWNPDTEICIVRVARDHYRMLWAALTLLTVINGVYSALRVIHVGGTMRSCNKRATDYDVEQYQISTRIET